MQKLIDAAAVYPREWAEVTQRRAAWAIVAPQVLGWLQEAAVAIQQAVPFFQDKLAVQLVPGQLVHEEVTYQNHELASIFFGMAPLAAALFHSEKTEHPLVVNESGFTLSFMPALNGEILVGLESHAIPGNKAKAGQLRVFGNPSDVGKPEVLALLEQAFTLAAPTSVAFSKEPEPAPGTRATVGFRNRNGNPNPASAQQVWDGGSGE